MTHKYLVGVVRTRMAKLGMTTYRLHALVSDKVSKQTVYNFVERGSIVHTDKLIAIMDVLGLTIIEDDSANQSNKNA